MKRLTQRMIIPLLVLLILTGTVSSVFAATYRPGAQSGPSPSYEDGSYFSNYTHITITGDNRRDLIAVALSQLGYQEGSADGNFSGEESGNNNYVEFNYNPGDLGLGFGGSDYPWCASFVSWCLYQSHCTDQGAYQDMARLHRGDGTYIWKEISCSQWARQLMDTGYYTPSEYQGGSYLPKSGDLVFFCQSGRIAHMGICLYTEGDRLYTLEGNTSDSSELVINGGGVYLKDYSLSASCIDGYGTLPYESDNSVSKIDYSGDLPTPGLYISNAVKYLYETETAESHSAIMNRFTMFEVTEVCHNGRLKVIAKERGGSTFIGYVRNNKDRVIQLTTTSSISKNNTVSLFDSPVSSMTPDHINTSATNISEPLYLKGSFNNWCTGLVMKASNDGSYSTTIILPAGAHAFKVATADNQNHWPISNNYTVILEKQTHVTVTLSGNVVSISCAY